VKVTGVDGVLPSIWNIAIFTAVVEGFGVDIPCVVPFIRAYLAHTFKPSIVKIHQELMKLAGVDGFLPLNSEYR
jgi:hypothetical protein